MEICRGTVSLMNDMLCTASNVNELYKQFDWTMKYGNQIIFRTGMKPTLSVNKFSVRLLDWKRVHPGLIVAKEGVC